MPQPQGGANLYQVTGEKARNARAATTDAKQAQFQARYASNYYACLKLLNLLLDKIKTNSKYSRGDKERSTPLGNGMPTKEEPSTAK